MAKLKIYDFLSEDKIQILKEIKIIENIHEKLLRLVDVIDVYSNHSQRISVISLYLGNLLGLSRDRLVLLEQSSLLHDVGKLGIDLDILLTKENLTDNEYKQIQKHVLMGGLITDFAGFNKKISTIIRYHHKWYNGKGYPDDDIKGKTLPIESRIISIVDAFDSIMSNRPYRKKKTLSEAYEIINSQSGEQFDPELVSLFNRNHKEIEKISNTVSVLHSDISVQQQGHAYNVFSNLYIKFNFWNTALEYLNRAKSILTDKDTIEYIENLLAFGIFHYQSNQHMDLILSLEYFLSALKHAQKLENLKMLSKIYFNLLKFSNYKGLDIINNYINSKNIDYVDKPLSKLILYNKAYQSAIKCENYDILPELCFQLSYHLIMCGEYDRGLYFTKEAKSYFDKVSESKINDIKIIYHDHAGLIYKMKGNYKKSLNHFSLAITQSMDYLNLKQLMWTYNGRGDVYLQMYRDMDAYNDFLKAMNLAIELEDYIELSGSYFNLARLNIETFQFDEALVNLKLSKMIKDKRTKEAKNFMGLHSYVTLYIYYGIANVSKNDMNEAWLFYEKVLHIIQNNDNLPSNVQTLFNYFQGLLHLRNSDFKKTELFFTKAIEHTDEPYLIGKIHELIAIIYKKKGDTILYDDQISKCRNIYEQYNMDRRLETIEIRINQLCETFS